jgi:rhodanese-related sulfurtransferase
VENDVDEVEVVELADWIIRGDSDYRRIDLRGKEEFAAYHIPGAEPVTVSELSEHDLARNERIILYAADPLRAAQAWFLLRARGYAGAAVLAGGLDAWRDNVLFPRLTDPETAEERRAAERAQQVAVHFGGQARGSAAAAHQPSVAVPVVEAPAHVPKQTRKRRRKKEGC